MDQFLRDGSNHRTDQYGGSIENRARLLLEVVDAISADWAPERIGVRVSPVSREKSMTDSDPVALFSHVAHQLSRRRIAYMHVLEGLEGSSRHVPGMPIVAPHIRRAFDGPLVLNAGYTRETAERAIANDAADAIAFGTAWLANPDLLQRWELAAPLNVDDPTTWYTHGEEGYTDYPTLADAVAAAKL